MERQGPALEQLLRRLSDTPADFLAEPRRGSSGTVSVAALVSDLVRELGGGPLSLDQIALLLRGDAPVERNRLTLVCISCWLLHDEWFRAQRGVAEPTLRFLVERVAELAAAMPAARFIGDPDRREELARLCLKECGLRPAGETEAQAQDRLTTLSLVERQRVIRAARAAEERAQAIRAEMARKAKAQAEADAKIMRE